MAGKRSRNKGASFERLVAKKLNSLSLAWAKWARNLEEVRTGVTGDVLDLNKVWPLVIQAKHRQRVNVLEALEQAEEGGEKLTAMYRGKPTFPVAWIRYHGGEELVAMRPELFGILLLAVDELAFHGFSTEEGLISQNPLCVMTSLQKLLKDRNHEEEKA